jgi:hypothetical protein
MKKRRMPKILVIPIAIIIFIIGWIGYIFGERQDDENRHHE